MQDIVISPMKPEHLPQVVGIENASYPDPWPYATFLREVEASKISVPIVAIRRQTVLGYIVSWMIMDEVHIGNVAVAVKHRRKGIGKLMMQWLMDEAARRRCTFSTLEVRESNEAARIMYENMNFRMVARRKAYYSKPVEDALVMLKSLKGGDHV